MPEGQCPDLDLLSHALPGMGAPARGQAGETADALDLAIPCELSCLDRLLT